MGPDQPLPYNEQYFDDADSYVASLLDFAGHDDLLQTLCGGVHLLDFFTSDPDLYSKILPLEWRDFFAQHEMTELLDLFMREDLEPLIKREANDQWRGGPLPPASLGDYLLHVRKHLLNRGMDVSQCKQNRTQKKLARHVAVGMNVKKVHEVGLFADYLNRLASSINPSGHNITHLVDFGSGQNYLGRALASEPYNRDIVAIESRVHNSERAKDFDVKARIVEKQRVKRNKKSHRAGDQEPAVVAAPPRSEVAKAKWPEIQRKDAVQYVDHQIQDGDLSEVIARISTVTGRNNAEQGIMVISLHSCGNLIHHGLRSIVLNPSVNAVAMVGCCYNLLTERLGPATYKLPELRPTTHLHPRLRNGKANGETNGATDGDPAGFPMSNRLAMSEVRLNITARMMAVQAPQNWSEKDSQAFFVRHFYRALLQRVFLDYGVVRPPSPECAGGVSPAGHSSPGTPITIGSLRKGCYESFVAYARGALGKLCGDEAVNPELGRLIEERMENMTDEVLNKYEDRFAGRKKDLSIIWSLMAFSAGVVESVILVDRWLWLTEQAEVEEAWVEPVFEYGISPRNLVVVGVKK